MNNDGIAVIFLVILIVLIGLWVAFVYATGKIAGDRGHRPLVWYLAAILFGPVAMLAALVSPYTPELVARAIAASVAATPAQRRAARVNAGPRDAGPSAPVSDELDPGRWEVASSTDPRVPLGEVVWLGRHRRLLLVRSEIVAADIDIDSLRGRDAHGLLMLEGDGHLQVTLRPLDGQTPTAAATSLGLL